MSKSMLSAMTFVSAQFEQDGEYFKELGLAAEKLQVSSTMKFDLEIDRAACEEGEKLKQALQRPTLVAGSTREGEEDKVLDAFQLMVKTIPDLLLVLVPRHPDRVDEVVSLLKRLQLKFVRRSSGEDIPGEAQVFLGDSLGEMQFYYATADVAFVGGSLVETGCQNIIEPAALGIPVITGPSLFNFKAVSALLRDAEAMRVVDNSHELADQVITLLEDKVLRQTMAQAARTVVENNQGATKRQQQLILQAIHSDQ